MVTRSTIKLEGALLEASTLLAKWDATSGGGRHLECGAAQQLQRVCTRPGASASNAKINITASDALIKVDGTSTLIINGTEVR